MSDTPSEQHERDAEINAAETVETAATAATPSTEQKKTPLQMVRERQAQQQASKRGGKNGGHQASGGGGAPGAGNEGKPRPQVKRQMGG